MKPHFTYFKQIACIALTTFLSAGCGEDAKEFPPLEGNIMLTNALEQIQTASSTTSECTIHFTTLQDWNTELQMQKKEETDEDWISITPVSGEKGEHIIKAFLLPNDKEYDRLATITIRCGEESLECSITQKQSDTPLQ